MLIKLVTTVYYNININISIKAAATQSAAYATHATYAMFAIQTD
jgi:hypothetical protein